MRRYQITLAVMALLSASAAALAGLSASVSGPISTSDPVRLLAVLAFATLGPGAAIMAHSRRVATATAWAMSLVLSLALLAIGSATMAWVGWWQPRAGLWLSAGVTAVTAIGALIRARRLPSLPRIRPAMGSWPQRVRLSLPHAATLAVAGGAWVFAVRHTDIGAVGDFGLLAAVHPVFFVALVATVAGFAGELLRGPRRGWLLSAYLLLLILAVHATTPVLLDQPQYAWTFKHIGVVEYLASGGSPTNAGDIYQLWPAMFSSVAALAGGAGTGVMQMAMWAPVFFNVIVSVVLFALAQRLSGRRAIAYGAVFLFQCLNWIEQDYLSPQALAFVLSLGAMLIVLTWLRSDVSNEDDRLDRRTRYAAVGAFAVVLFAVTAAHQLSPFLIAAAVITLVVLRRVRPRWLAIVAVAVPIAYLAPRFGFVSRSFGLFESFDLLHNASGNTQTWGTVGQAFSALAVRVLSIVVWLLAALAVVRLRRDPRAVLVPAVLAVLPFGLIAAQSYGGEAIYRVYLFSAPWCALLIATAAVGLRWRPALGALVSGTVLTAMAMGTMQGRHGQLEVDQVSSAEVAAARYLYAHAKPDSTVLMAAPGFPARVSANYGSLNAHVPYGDPDLVTSAQLSHVVLNDAYLPVIENYAASLDRPKPTKSTYLVISDGMRRYAHYFGALPDGSLDALDGTLGASKQWSLFYRNADVSIYQLPA